MKRGGTAGGGGGETPLGQRMAEAVRVLSISLDLAVNDVTTGLSKIEDPIFPYSCKEEEQ